MEDQLFSFLRIRCSSTSTTKVSMRRTSVTWSEHTMTSCSRRTPCFTGWTTFCGSITPTPTSPTLRANEGRQKTITRTERTEQVGYVLESQSVCVVFVVHISCVWFCVYECNDFLRTSRDCRLPTVLFLTIFCGCAILYECNYCIRTKRLVFQYVLQIRDFVYVSGVTSYEQAANRGFQAQNVLRAWDFHVFSTPVLCSCWLFRDYIVIWMWS